MPVVATAGHVDHGKSALVRALSGTDPDRLAEERRRGLTIELGHAWCVVGGERVGLVDVPGHDGLVGTTVAGLGPVGAVLLVVAADEGWSAQTEEHARAVRALGCAALALVVSKTDLADPGPVLRDARHRLGVLGLRPVATATTSVRGGTGLDGVRRALAALVAATPATDPAAPTVLWVDRSFTVRGAGTVVTGTMAAGTVRAGEVLDAGGTQVRVRGLEVHGEPVATAGPHTRVALNLRDLPPRAVPRGTVLATPGSRPRTRVVDVALDPVPQRVPARCTLHVGTTSVPVRQRPLGPAHARLTLLHDEGLPLAVGDRGLLRDPGAHEVLAGVRVLDVAPPPLSRRGDPARRGLALAEGRTAPDPGPGSPPAPGPQPVPDLDRLCAWLEEHPLAAAPGELLAAPGLTPAVLAAAEREGRLLRTGGVVLAPSAPTAALSVLAGLDRPVGPGEAARALGTSRRVAVALLERLARRSLTARRPDGTHVVLRTGSGGTGPTR